jgi:hypothetical protein
MKMANATPSQVEKRKAPDLGATQEHLAQLLDAAMSDFEECNFDGAAATLSEMETILVGERRDDSVFEAAAEEFGKSAGSALKDAKKAPSPEKQDRAFMSPYLTISQLIELVESLGPSRESSDYISGILATKSIVHNKRAYRILAYRCVAGKSYIQLEGFEHVQFLEREATKGWIPLDAQAIERVLGEEAARAVKRLEEHLPVSPQEMVDLITSLRDSKTPASSIRQKLIETRPTIKVGGHGALVDDYAEKDAIPLIHLQGFPQKVWLTLDKAAIESIVPIAHLIKPLDDKLASVKPLRIDGIAAAVSAKRKDIGQLAAFGFTKEEIDVLLLLNEKKGVMIA